LFGTRRRIEAQPKVSTVITLSYIYSGLN